MNFVALFPFLAWFKLLSLDTLKADLGAGLTGAVIVLPQGVAFATIAGLPPEYGLYTAMVTPIIAALFGSSFHLVSGPTTAISIVVFSSISNYATPGSPEFISLAITLTFLAGVYQLAFGIARLGTIVNFVSHTVVIGFTAGAAILIATSQLKPISGIDITKDESFLSSWIHFFTDIDQSNLNLLLIAAVTLAVSLVFKKLVRRSPYLLLGMLAGSLVALLLQKFDTSITFIGEIPAHLPPLSKPDFSLATIRTLAPEAFAVALLGLIEAVSISRAVATKSNQRINSNQEFIGQGMSNMVGSFFSCYAGSGSFTRSGINYSSGAKTPLSAIIAAVALMVIVLLIAPLTRYLPIAAMGGVILLVAYNLIDFRHIWQILRFSKSEASILLTTFFATLFLDLEFAIYLGVLLSLVLFLSKTSTPQIPTLSVDANTGDGSRKLVNIDKKPLNQCPQLKIIRIDMSIYFGSINHIVKRLAAIADKEQFYHILILGSGINFIDLAGAQALVAENNSLKKQGGGLYFAGLKASVYEFAAKSCFIKQIGNDHFYDNKHKALASIYRKLDKQKCEKCTARIFEECM